MKKFLLILLLFPLSLSAQINRSDTLKFKTSLSLTGIWQDGNVQTKIFRARSDMSVIPLENFLFKTNNSYVYQAFGNQKADEDILSLNFLYLHPDKNVHSFLLGFVSTNFRRGINLRYLYGAGASFRLLSDESRSLKLSLSSEYEQTDFSDANFNRSRYNGNKSISTIRGTIWVRGKYQLFDNKMVFSHESYFQPSLELHNNYRWQADLGLEFPLWDFLNFKINYLHTFESIVIVNQIQEDRFLTFGFTIKNFK